jgi:hypothetical protein
MDFTVNVDLWQVMPDCYIDLRPFAFEMTQENYVFGLPSGEVSLISKSDMMMTLSEYRRIGLILSNNILSTRMFVTPTEKSITDIIAENYSEDAIVDYIGIGEIGIDSIYVVNSIDEPSKRVVEQQLGSILQESSVVRTLPASFVVAHFINSLNHNQPGTYLALECRPFEIYLYAWTMFEQSNIPVTLTSDSVKTNVNVMNSIAEKAGFMNHKVGRLFKTDLISKAFILTHESSVGGVPVKEISSVLMSVLKKIEIEVIDEPYPAIKGAWSFEKA